MKILRILFALVVILIALAAVGLQLFLKHNLTAVLKDHVIPTLQADYGIDLDVENASINLIKGQATFLGTSVRDVVAFKQKSHVTCDRCVITVEWSSLIKREPIIIKSIVADGAQLTVARLTKEEQAAAKAAQEEAPAKEVKTETAASETSETSDDASSDTPIHIRRITINGTVTYSHPDLEERISVDVRLTASSLFSAPSVDQPSSLLVLRGNMTGEPERFKTDLNAILQPLVDPANPTFNATGTIEGIDKSIIDDTLEKNDMSCSDFSIKPAIVCSEGQLDGSTVDIRLSDLKLNSAKLGDTTLPIGLEGPIASPKVDVTAALRALFTDNALNLFKAIGLDTEPETEESSVDDSDSNSDDKVDTEEEPANLGDLLLNELGKNVKEVQEGSDIRNVLQDLLGN